MCYRITDDDLIYLALFVNISDFTIQIENPLI